MHEDRRAHTAGDVEHIGNLGARRLRCVGHAEAHADGAPRESPGEARSNLDDLQRRRFLARCGSAWQEGAGVLHHHHPDGNVADARAEVDRRLPRALRVPRIDIRRADFEFERRGNAVGGLSHVVGGRLAVLVEVDEAGSDHEAARVDRRAALERRRADHADDASGDTDVPNGVRVRLGIHHAAIGDDEIERSRLWSLRQKVDDREQRGGGGEQTVLHLHSVV